MVRGDKFLGAIPQKWATIFTFAGGGRRPAPAAAVGASTTASTVVPAGTLPSVDIKAAPLRIDHEQREGDEERYRRSPARHLPTGFRTLSTSHCG